MKTTNILKCLAIVAALFIYSCSSDSDGDGDGGQNQGGTSGITSITVTASSNSIELGGSVTFTVTGNDGSDLTGSSSILVNNSTIQGMSYTPTATGSFQINAKYQTLTSSPININVTPPVITAIRVETTSSSMKVGDTADFIVIGTDASNNDYTVTDTATISVNGTAIEGSRYMATTMGDLTATATLDALTADPYTVL